MQIFSALFSIYSCISCKLFKFQNSTELYIRLAHIVPNTLGTCNCHLPFPRRRHWRGGECGESDAKDGWGGGGGQWNKTGRRGEDLKDGGGWLVGIFDFTSFSFIYFNSLKFYFDGERGNHCLKDGLWDNTGAIKVFYT